MFMAFGGFFCLYSVYNYNIGTAFRMGPGYFPMLLGGFLFFLGFLITAKSVLFKSSEEDGGKFGKFDWYNFFVILGSVRSIIFLSATVLSAGFGPFCSASF